MSDAVSDIPPIGGFCAERFAGVRDLFEASLRDGRETGASVCVNVGGEVVVDLWGGWRDAARTQPWERDTVAATYSVTKVPAALSLLWVVDRGGIGLDDPVASVWPEFAAAGKADATVRHLLSHQAGLPAFPEPRPSSAWADWAGLTAMLAAATPEWPPGERMAEHALTYGHLLGEVVRRVDGRTLGEVWRAELAGPLGLDFQIGLTADECARAAEMEYAEPSWPEEMAGRPGSLRHRALANPDGALDLAVLDSDLWRRTQVPAVNGHGTARAVATLYAALGGFVAGLPLSEPMRQALLTPVRSGPDELLDRDVSWGLGPQFEDDYVGMGGIGGSDGLLEVRRGFSFGYVTRRLADHERAIALSDAVERALDR